MRVLAIFGPTAVGKTGVAIEVGELLRARGEDPVAISCDAIQVYQGLEILSGAATAEERERLEHRMLGIVPIDGEFSAGRFANLVHPEIDQLLAEDRRPILVGGTGLYMRAALSELELRPPVPAEVRDAVEREIAERGPAALHAELSPELVSGVHPNDRKRIARLTELTRLGIAPHSSAERLWSEDLRVAATLIGLTVDREELRRRVPVRVEEMLRRGAVEEVRAADAAGASRTARAAIGFEELLAGDVEGMKRAQLRYARRQLTWMRRMEGVTLIDRAGRSDREVAGEIVGLLDREEEGER
ncbi:MAG TPA: tRNA (adenosine(37)-N6)-dimethylallyltransferase MiaA [Solirubrobacterales bacterium]|nr:tRNA (adenosine(37)-N6)-dimethylallyltransferase MiaA [Solirubrobacterales bacterium]